MLKQFFKIQLFMAFIDDPQMLSCLSFMSWEKYGSEEKKYKPKYFSLSAEHFFAVALTGLCVQGSGRGLHGPCALGGCLGAGGGTWRLLPALVCPQPQQCGLCLCCGQSEAGQGYSASWGTCVTSTRSAQ